MPFSLDASALKRLFYNQANERKQNRYFYKSPALAYRKQLKAELTEKTLNNLQLHFQAYVLQGVSRDLEILNMSSAATNAG